MQRVQHSSDHVLFQICLSQKQQPASNSTWQRPFVGAIRKKEEKKKRVLKLSALKTKDPSKPPEKPPPKMQTSQKPSAPQESGSGSSRVSSGGGPPGGSSSSISHHHYTYEERLNKAWRNMASSIVGAFQKSEKAASETTKETLKELDEAVVTFIRARMEWHRLISLVEARLQGKAQELEALNTYVRTQPRLGKRKREDDPVEEAILTPTQEEVVVAGTVPDTNVAPEAKID